MLYKKIHRQYLREFWKGRKFEYKNEVCEVIEEPYIGEGSIWVYYGNVDYVDYDFLELILITGELWHKNDITFLD